MTYHDVEKLMRRMAADPLLSEAEQLRLTTEVPEIVYALTNEKGRNRDERANERYYAGIRSVHFASFVKMCDRLANIRYTTLFYLTNRMLAVYRNEYPVFIQAITEGSVTPVPSDMRQEMETLLHDDHYMISDQTLND